MQREGGSTQEAIKFISKCLLHNLNPKFVRFKLYKDSASRSKAAVNFLQLYFQRKLTQSEPQVHSKCLRIIEEGVVRRQEKTFRSLTLLLVFHAFRLFHHTSKLSSFLDIALKMTTLIFIVFE